MSMAMLVSLFQSIQYGGPVHQGGWPIPVSDYSRDVARASMEGALEFFELADQVGFDWVTVAEHHYHPFSLTPNPMVMAGALTERVKRAKIAVLGPNIPIQNPVRVAEEFAMLDTLSGGRLVAGMLRGTLNEYVTYNVNPAESRERFREAMKLILWAWSEPQPFGWQGRFYEYRSICIWPRPVQQPRPPIYMSTSSPEMAELAAENRLNAAFAVTSVPFAKPSAELYRAAARQHGWDPQPEQVLYRVGAHVTESDEQALEDLAPRHGGAHPSGTFSTANPSIEEAARRAGYYGRDVEHQRGRVFAVGDLQQRIREGRILAGSPATVLDQVRTIRDELGAGVVEMVIASPTRDKARRAIELIGAEVLPKVHEL